jgi:hypothetical protein
MTATKITSKESTPQYVMETKTTGTLDEPVLYLVSRQLAFLHNHGRVMVERQYNHYDKNRQL